MCRRCDNPETKDDMQFQINRNQECELCDIRVVIVYGIGQKSCDEGEPSLCIKCLRKFKNFYDIHVSKGHIVVNGS